MASRLPPLKRAALVLFVAGVVGLTASLIKAKLDGDGGHLFGAGGILGAFALATNKPAWIARVRSLGYLAAGGTAGGSLAVLLTVNPDLLQTELRLQFTSCVLSTLLAIGTAAVALWVANQLNKPPISQSLTEAGLRPVSPRLVLMGGVAGLVVILAATFVVQSTQAAATALDLAHTQVGPGYRLQVGSLRINYAGAARYSAVVTAWSHNEIRTIPVHWTGDRAPASLRTQVR